jgi:DNA repair ATPase RecN
MPDRYPGTRALSDAALRETLDLLGQVVASMSARIDTHGEKIDEQERLIVMMMEALADTRDAARRAAKQTDAKTYAGQMVEALDANLDPLFRKLENAIGEINQQHRETTDRLKQLEQAENAGLDKLRQELTDASAWRRKVPVIWASAVGLVIVLTVGLSVFFSA